MDLKSIAYVGFAAIVAIAYYLGYGYRIRHSSRHFRP